MAHHMRYPNTQRLLLLTPSQNTAYVVSWKNYISLPVDFNDERTFFVDGWLIENGNIMTHDFDNLKMNTMEIYANMDV